MTTMTRRASGPVDACGAPRRARGSPRRCCRWSSCSRCSPCRSVFGANIVAAAHHAAHPGDPRRRCGTPWPATAGWSRSGSRPSSASARTARSSSPSTASPPTSRWCWPSLASAVLAAFVSLLVLRLRGGQFAVGTWVVAETLALLVVARPGAGRRHRHLAARAQRLRPRSAPRLHLLDDAGLRRPAPRAAVPAAAPARPAPRCRPSATTRRPRRRSASGSRPLKFMLFVLAGFGCGAAGALILANTLFIQPQSIFGVQWSAYMIFMVLVGGLGTFEGPILGAIVFFAIQYQFADHGAWYLIGLGAIASSSRCSCPGGCGALIDSRLHVQLLPVGYRLQQGRGGDSRSGRGELNLQHYIDGRLDGLVQRSHLREPPRPVDPTRSSPSSPPATPTTRGPRSRQRTPRSRTWARRSAGQRQGIFLRAADALERRQAEVAAPARRARPAAARTSPPCRPGSALACCARRPALPYAPVGRCCRPTVPGTTAAGGPPTGRRGRRDRAVERLARAGRARHRRAARARQHGRAQAVRGVAGHRAARCGPSCSRRPACRPAC